MTMKIITDDGKNGNKYCDFIIWSPYIPILGTINIGHPWIWNISAAALAGLPWCCELLNSTERDAVSFESDNDTQYTTEAETGDSNGTS